MPKANADYWRAKIARNRARDVKTLVAYAAMGWRALVIYECELKDKAALGARLAEAVNAGPTPGADARESRTGLRR
jgi:DNA mismatch endonuclease (patch repair protein)